MLCREIPVSYTLDLVLCFMVLWVINMSKQLTSRQVWCWSIVTLVITMLILPTAMMAKAKNKIQVVVVNWNVLGLFTIWDEHAFQTNIQRCCILLFWKHCFNLIIPYKLFRVQWAKTTFECPERQRQIRKAALSTCILQEITSHIEANTQVHTQTYSTDTKVVWIYRFHWKDRMAPKLIMSQPAFTLLVKIYNSQVGKLLPRLLFPSRSINSPWSMFSAFGSRCVWPGQRFIRSHSESVGAFVGGSLLAC